MKEGIRSSGAGATVVDEEISFRCVGHDGDTTLKTSNNFRGGGEAVESPPQNVCKSIRREGKNL